MSLKRKKTTKKIGTSSACLILLCLFLAAALPGADRKKEEKKLAAVIAGTVFRDPGFADTGAEVELVEAGIDGKKVKSRKAITDRRGEFAFSVPPVAQKYKVKAAAKGLRSEEKETSSVPGARVDVFFTLKPAVQ